MVNNAAGKNGRTPDSTCSTAEQLTALRQAVKDCYCGLGQACTHWEEMTPEDRVACSRDKRAYVEALWRNGTAA